MPSPLMNALLALQDESIIDEVIATHFTLKSPYLYYRWKYAISKWGTDIRHTKTNWNYLGDGIILGTLPYRSQCDEIIDYAAKQGKSLGLVISIVDYFELGGDPILDPIATPLDWSKKNVEHYCQPMQDFTSAISIAAIIPAIEKMRTCILNNQAVFIHCKAGVGRSALFTAIYFGIFNLLCTDLESEPSLNKAISIIKRIREQVSLDLSKRQKALNAISIIKKILKQEDISLKDEKEKIQPIPSDILQTDEKEIQDFSLSDSFVKVEKEIQALPSLDSTFIESKECDELQLSEEFIKVPVPAPLKTTFELAKLNQFLSSFETKLEIAQLVWYKQLVIYGASIFGFSNRATIIDSFIKEIGRAKNADWYLSYHEKLRPLIDANPVLSIKRPGELLSNDSTQDKKIRKDLFKNFYNEVTEYINTKLEFKLEILPEEKQTDKSDLSSTSSTSITDLIKHGLYASTAAINTAYTLCTSTTEQKISQKTLACS